MVQDNQNRIFEGKKKEYQRKYRAKKKLEKRVHNLMMEVQALNRQYLDKFGRFDIMDFE